MPNHCNGRCSGVEKLIVQIHVSWGGEEKRREVKSGVPERRRYIGHKDAGEDGNENQKAGRS